MTEDELLLGCFRNVPESAADAVKRSGEKAPEYSGIFRYFHENGLVPYALQSQTDVRGTLETLAKNPSGCPKLFGLLGDIMQRDDFPDPRGRALLRNPGFRTALSEYLQDEFYTELCLSRCRVAHLKPGSSLEGRGDAFRKVEELLGVSVSTPGRDTENAPSAADGADPRGRSVTVREADVIRSVSDLQAVNWLCGNTIPGGNALHFLEEEKAGRPALAGVNISSTGFSFGTFSAEDLPHGRRFMPKPGEMLFMRASTAERILAMDEQTVRDNLQEKLTEAELWSFCERMNELKKELQVPERLDVRSRGSIPAKGIVVLPDRDPFWESVSLDQLREVSPRSAFGQCADELNYRYAGLKKEPALKKGRMRMELSALESEERKGKVDGAWQRHTGNAFARKQPVSSGSPLRRKTAAK